MREAELYIKEKELYIPVNAPDAEDYVQGIGNKEISIITLVSAVTLIGAVIAISLTRNMLVPIFATGIIITFAVMLVKRDIYGETPIKKVKVWLDYIKSQKMYHYKYHNIYEEHRGEDDE
jgi:hypothetical protein